MPFIIGYDATMAGEGMQAAADVTNVIFCVLHNDLFI
jgi:hypothetical protein